MQPDTKALRCRTTAWPTRFGSDRWEGRSRSDTEQIADVWGRFLGRVPWDWFATLTFDPKRVFPVSRELASREAFKWCSQLGHLYRRPVAWVYAVEPTPSGLWHSHALIVGAGDPEWLPALEAWRVRNGRAHVATVRDVTNAALYRSKALARDGEIVWSDTLIRYKTRLAEVETVPVYY